MKFAIFSLKKLLLFLFILFLIILLLCFSNIYVDSISSTLDIFLNSVFPALFPFMLFTEIILQTKIIDGLNNIFKPFLTKLFNMSEYCITPIILGFLCGFPSGTKATNELIKEKNISRREAIILLSLTNNFNPAFIVSTIGVTLFHSMKIGVILFFTHYISAILLGIIISKIYPRDIIHENTKNLNRNFKNPALSLRKVILSPFISLGMILSFMIIFNLIYDYFLYIFNYLNLYINPAIFEITRGSKEIIFLNLPLNNIIVLESFFLGFSGLCILFQIYTSLEDINVKFSLIVILKLFHGIISSIISIILLKLLNISFINTMFSITSFKNIDTSITTEDFKNSLSISYLYSIGIIILFVILTYIYNIIKNKKAAKLLATYKEGG